LARKKRKGTELSVFKGREAKLNRAIFHVLAKEEPQTTRALRKKIIQIKGLKDTSYSTVNKRVRNLEQKGYIRKVVVEERLGGITNYYELRPKAYLAKFFDSITIEDLIEQANDKTALTMLGTLISTRELSSGDEE
jgi:DNA-binding PadR family transcriptional regulator